MTGEGEVEEGGWAPRGGKLIATLTFAGALVGFATGLHQASPGASRARSGTAPATSRATSAVVTSAREAVPYHELAARGPNARWRAPRHPDAFPCSQCHEAATQDDRQRRTLELEHAALRLAHGKLWCFDCHDAQDRDALHLADGSPVPLDEPTALCAQCHGTALRDYERGSHGGMTGAWDAGGPTQRGPYPAGGERQRAHCLDCHAAHAPERGLVLPVFAPRDRFVNDGNHGGQR